VTAAVVVAAGLFGLLLPSAAQGSSSIQQQATTGKAAVIAELGLTPSPTDQIEGCQYILDDNGTGYCLDGNADSYHEAWQIWMRARGIAPSELDERVYAARQAFLDFPDEQVPSREYYDLVERYQALKAQQTLSWQRRRQCCLSGVSS
jgi:hypothetical protein